MKLNWFCLLIVVAHFCFNVTLASSSDDDGVECLGTYLHQKGKLSADFPIRESGTQSPPIYCRFVTAITLRVVQSLIESSIQEVLPKDADCLKSEFKNQETLDVIVKLSVIEDSNLSENDINTQTNVTRDELKQDLIKIALQCETDEKKFIEIFNSFLGIKNETLAALHHNYCFAKYAADNELLPLNGIELNSNGIVTSRLDCNAIIKKERRKHERNAREKVKANNPKSLNCVMDAYVNQNVFNIYVVMNVIDYVEFPKETKDEESNKVANKFADFTRTVGFCTFNASYT